MSFVFIIVLLLYKLYKMNTVRVTTDNVHQYIGHQIIFRVRNKYNIKQLLGVSGSGESLRIDYPEVGNSLNITRAVYVLL